MTTPRRWLSTIFLLLLLTAESRQQQQQQPTTTTTHRPVVGEEDFLCTRVLQDGEVERRVRRGRISAMETAVVAPSAGAALLTLVQATDGRHLIQLIYDSGWELRDCEYVRSAKSVDEFYESFAADPDCRGPYNSNSTSSPSSPVDMTDYASLRRECKGLHRRIRQGALLHRRPKRDLFLYPGTNWCGSGSNARKFNELGYNAAADRCCRDHDHCPHTIEGFTRKFHFFNLRFHTISHCDCDERFRACLKMSGTAAGNMVGRLFFNVVQTKCFLFKHIKRCAKRSWWGKCLRYDRDKAAELRDALKY